MLPCVVLSGKGVKRIKDAIVPACLLHLTFHHVTFVFASEDVKRALDPRTLDPSQTSSVLNNNLVNPPPPPPPPTPVSLDCVTPLFLNKCLLSF